jgi:hypothetical protein
VQLRIKGTISQISLYNIKTDISGACLSPVYIEDTQARFIKLRLLEWHDSPATGLTVMANNDVDGGAAPDLPARGRELFERPSGREVGAAGANDRAGAARWAAAQDRNAGGDERHSLFAAHQLPLAKANLRAGC